MRTETECFRGEMGTLFTWITLLASFLRASGIIR